MTRRRPSGSDYLEAVIRAGDPAPQTPEQIAAALSLSVPVVRAMLAGATWPEVLKIARGKP